MYEKILVPYASSRAGDMALEHAAKIAKDNGSKLTILHVVEDIPIPPLLAFNFERHRVVADIKNARGELQMAMHETLDAKAKDLRDRGVDASVNVLHGEPYEEIMRFILDEDYNLVVMAKRKKLSGAKSILKIGSVSRKILEKVSCPILFIDAEGR